MTSRRPSRIREALELVAGSVAVAAVLYGLLFVGGILQLLTEGAP